METLARKVIVTEDEPHRLRTIRVLLEQAGHEIVAVATTRSVALQAIGDIGTTGADVILLDGNLMPEAGQEQDTEDGADAKAILAAIAAARKQRGSDGGGELRMDVVAIGEYPMTEYGITEGITRDLGEGRLFELPEVIARL